MLLLEDKKYIFIYLGEPNIFVSFCMLTADELGVSKRRKDLLAFRLNILIYADIPITTDL